MKTNAKNIEDLISAFLNVGLTAQEQNELQQLLKDPDNREYFRKMYVIWHASNRTMKDEDVEHALQKALFRINNNMLVQPSGEPVIVRRRFSFWKVAAVLAVLITTGGTLYYALNTGNPVSTYSTDTNTNINTTATVQSATPPDAIPVDNEITVPLGSRSTVALPDGTIVTLNAGSCLQYAASFGENNREVMLEGEGYFNVARNEAIPFVVRVKDITIKALGTEFNVTAYPEEKTIRTTLVKGSVSIRKAGNDSSIEEVILKPQQTAIIKYATSASDSENTIQLSEAENLVAQSLNDSGSNDSGDVILEKSAKKTVLYTSWKDARWVVESEPLEELAVKLQRRYNVNILMDDDLKRYPFSGILTDETLEQVLEIMKLTVPINYNVKQKTVWLKIDPQQYKVFEKLMKKQI